MQFLTDSEYKALRVDVGTILCGVQIDTRAEFRDGQVYITNIVMANDAADKLTAYVDQKIKQYY